MLSEAVLGGFERIHRAVSELTGADADRPVQITTTPAFAANWLMPRLAAFRQKNPGISLMMGTKPSSTSFATFWVSVTPS